MKFAQHFIDKVNGKTRALKDRNEKIKGLNSSLSQQYQDSLVEIEQQLQRAADSLNISGLKNAIKEVQQSKSKVKRITEALLRCLDADPSLLEEILLKPEDHFSYFVTINYEPLHLLTALHIHHGLDFKASIIKLLSNPNIGYRFEAYGIIPAEEILELDTELRQAMLDRILIDIVEAIKSANFEKATSLIELDSVYFKNAIIPSTGGKTILFIAAQYLVDQNFFEKQKLDFLDKLINEYGCDIDALDASGVSCKQLLIQLIGEHRDISARQGFDGVYLPVAVSSFSRKTYQLSFCSAKRNELLKEVSILSQIPANKLAPSDISLLDLSNFRDCGLATEYSCYNAHITVAMAEFIKKFILPRLNKISINNSTFELDALTIIWEGISQNYDITEIYCPINDKNIANLLQTINSRYLTSLALYPLHSEMGFATEIVSYLSSGRDRLKECSLQIEADCIDYEIYLAIIKHNHSIKVDYTLNIYHHFPIEFYLGLGVILDGSPKLKCIYITGIIVSAKAASIILGLLNTCGNINNIKILNCTLEADARPIIASIKGFGRIPNRIVSGSQIDSIEIFDPNPEDLPADIVATKNPHEYLQKLTAYNQLRAAEQYATHLAELHDKMSDAVNMVISDNFFGSITRDSYDHKYKDLLTATDIAFVNSLVTGIYVDSSVAEVLNKLGTIIKINIDQIKNDFFSNYMEEVHSNYVSWYGSIADLNIIARIFCCKILLHTDYVDIDLKTKSRILEFGSISSATEIHLVRQGNTYFGYSSKYHTLIPNIADDLNLFRACIHAFMDEKCPFFDFLTIADKYVAELRFATSACMEYSKDLCAKTHEALLSEFIEAQDRDVAYQYAKNLPQHNFEVIEKLIQYKRILDAIQTIQKRVASLGIGHLKDKVQYRIKRLFRNQKRADDLIYIIRDLRADNPNNINIQELDVADIESHFAQHAVKLVDQQEQRRLMLEDKLQAAEAELAQLEALKPLLIQALNEQIDQIRAAGIIDINAHYRASRRAFKKALIKAGVGAALSFACLEIFAGPLAQLLFSSNIVGSATLAKIAADSIIGSLVANVMAGGKLKRLPEEISKSFIISVTTNFATSSLTNGYDIHNLPSNAAYTKLVVTTQMTIESSVRAAFTKRNIADEALATGIAATLLGCAIGIDSTDKEMKLVFDPSLTALKEVIKGSSSDTIAMEVALQVVQSLATVGMLRFLRTVKPQPSAALDPAQPATAKVYSAGDAVEDDFDANYNAMDDFIPTSTEETLSKGLNFFEQVMQDAEEIETEFSSHRSSGSRGIKMLGGAVVGVGAKAAEITADTALGAFKLLGCLTSMVDEFETAFNPEQLTDTHEAEVAEFLKRQQDARDKLDAIYKNVKQAVSTAPTLVASGAIKFGKNIFETVQLSDSDPSAAGAKTSDLFITGTAAAVGSKLAFSGLMKGVGLVRATSSVQTQTGAALTWQYAGRGAKQAGVKCAGGSADNFSRFTHLTKGQNRIETLKMCEEKLKGVIPDAQYTKLTKTIKKASGKSQVHGIDIATFNVKIEEATGSIHLEAMRPGYDGYQKMSHKITVDGERARVVQTAYDKHGNIVAQKPGAPKNNFFDMKW